MSETKLLQSFAGYKLIEHTYMNDSNMRSEFNIYHRDNMIERW
jgi:hypothetical protein